MSDLMKGAALVVALLLIAPCAVAQDQAGPDAGVAYVLEVMLADPQAGHELVERGYNVSHLTDETASVYATEEEYARLLQDGYSVREVGRQPSPPLRSTIPKGLGTYQTYDSMTILLEGFAADFPAISRLSSLGLSTQGRELWALLISDNPDVEEDEPEFKYVGTMHGDEVVGTEMLLYLIDRLLNDYGEDDRITTLVDDTAIWIVPLMNPDGFELGRRSNAVGADLNRSFPAFPFDFEGTIFEGTGLFDEDLEPEVAHMVRWSAENSFVLSANTHGGALLVNYPYDHEVGISSGTAAPSADEDLFEEISLRYSEHNPPMFNSLSFDRGITNGSDWFSIVGGMQDWNYRYLGCNEVTLELSNIKRPPQDQLMQFWAENEESMLAYLESVHMGIRGVVTDRETGEPLWAQATIAGNAQPVFSDPDVGDYHRMLLPGDYTLRVAAPGYVTWTRDEVVVTEGEVTRVDVALADPDVDNDGSTGALDIQWIINAILRDSCPFDCDVDGGGVTSTDLQALVNAILQRIEL